MVGLMINYFDFKFHSCYFYYYWSYDARIAEFLVQSKDGTEEFKKQTVQGN